MLSAAKHLCIFVWCRELSFRATGRSGFRDPVVASRGHESRDLAFQITLAKALTLHHLVPLLSPLPHTPVHRDHVGVAHLLQIVGRKR
jgi:hypothetical protein